ncbi:hypothetical protein [Streptomyces sp. NPDC057002]|uniref:hypothetical protein n=1 Tax=Streptomyces sp. NPDC057002 TaxID=3345992 RepID=UPI0036321831
MGPQVHVTLLDEDHLIDDPCPDQPFRLTFQGWWQDSPEGGHRVADLNLRMDSADLADLRAQIRAQELALASRARRQAEAEADERARGTQVAWRYTGPSPHDPGVLARVRDALLEKL